MKWMCAKYAKLWSGTLFVGQNAVSSRSSKYQRNESKKKHHRKVIQLEIQIKIREIFPCDMALNMVSESIVTAQ